MMQHTDDTTVSLTTAKPRPSNDATAKKSSDENLVRTQTSLGFGFGVLISTSSSRLAGIVQGISPHTISILVKEPIPERSAVSIEFGRASRAGDIVSCIPKAGRFEISVAIPNSSECELRTADRFPLTQQLQIQVDGLEEQLPAFVVDVSADGVGLEVSTPLEKGRMVTLENDSNIAFGIIRHSEAFESGRFHAGVEVIHVMSKDE